MQRNIALKSSFIRKSSGCETRGISQRTLFISALARFNHIFENSSFSKIKILAGIEKTVLDEEFAHDLEFSVAVACYVRLQVYMEKSGQEDFHYSADESQQLIDHMNQLMGEDTPVKFFTIVMRFQREVCKAIGKKILILCIGHLN